MYGDCDDGCNCMQWIPLLSALIIVEDNIVESLVYNYNNDNYNR